MHPIVIHIANGQSFFTGTFVFLIGVYLCRNHQTKRRGRLGSLFIISGLLLAVISATPFSIWVWVLLCVSAVLMLNRRLIQKSRLTALTCCVWLVAVVVEAFWHFTPHLPNEVASRNLPVVVLADSVTAGLGEGEAVTWPVLLQAQYDGDVIDLSHVGETVQSSLKRISSEQLPEAAVFILELGGNDILGSTSAEQFSQGLDKLLTHLCSKQRTVLLFELPLLPFHNHWGRTQRNLCSKHGVLLIPKHRLASVFRGDTSTLDSIHLSQEGHNRMVNIVKELLRPGR